jgi:hypothetical protein
MQNHAAALGPCHFLYGHTQIGNSGTAYTNSGSQSTIAQQATDLPLGFASSRHQPAALVAIDSQKRAMAPKNCKQQRAQMNLLLLGCCWLCCKAPDCNAAAGNNHRVDQSLILRQLRA